MPRLASCAIWRCASGWHWETAIRFADRALPRSAVRTWDLPYRYPKILIPHNAPFGPDELAEVHLLEFRMRMPRLGVQAAQPLVNLPRDHDDKNIVGDLDVFGDELVLEAEIFGKL